MAYDGYLKVGDVELCSPQAAHYGATGWAQTASKASIRDVWPCPGLPQALGYAEGWSTPANDGAGWYDPTEKHSPWFGGLLIQEVAGLAPGVMTRDVTERAGPGAAVSVGRQLSPQIVVTGVLIGRDCCATAYGLRWLRTVLGRQGDVDLRYLEAAPLDVDEDCPDAPTAVERFAPYWRTLRRVGVTSGVQVIERIGASCGGCGSTEFMRVQFVLNAGLPWAFRDPVTVTTGQRWVDPSTITDFQWVATADGEPCPVDTAEECPPADDCAGDPDCAPPPPPPLPLPAQTPCTACTPFETRRLVVDVPDGVVPGSGEGVPVVQVYSGTSGPLRHLRLRWWANPDGQTPDYLNPCAALPPLHVGYLPENSTLLIDGQTGRTWVTCPGSGQQPGAGVVSGPPGDPVTWPALSAGAWTLIADVDGAASWDATVSVSVAVREC